MVVTTLILTGCFLFGPGGGEVNPSVIVSKAPANPQTITLIVSGDDQTIVKSISPTATQVDLSLPAGVWSFELIIETPSAKLRGFTTAALVSGDDSTVVIDMELDWTKLVLPDNTGGRILQFDDISGSGQLELKGSAVSNIGFSDFDFQPYDLDFDDQGRIFIANFIGGSGMGRNAVIRVDDISGSGGVLFTEPEYDYGIRALTVDRNNKFVYYAPTNASSGPYTIYRSDLDGAGQVGIALNAGVDTVQTVFGMAVDDTGKLYIAGVNGTGLDRIFRVDPTPPTGNVEATFQTSLNNPWDVLVKPSYVYIANNNGGAGNAILQLNKNLQFVKAHGDEIDGTNTNPGQFYGPHRFVAIVNKRITVVDDDFFGSNNDKLVSIDDINGSNWMTLPKTGNGQSLFTFFNLC
jgi:hypothetical protein